ncbi:MAG: hypoxanthine phosphoribosyltransferase [Bacteroidales bacterium]|nr:hypoxanthine phosphoribosyltransferase [Bacteroidales bacterium]
MNDKSIVVNDKRFKLFMTEAEILHEVQRVADEISRDLKGENPIFCPTLTGAFMFMSDLAKALDFDAMVQFVKFASYSGMASTGKVRNDLIFSEKCRGRHVVIVEDIVDTGITMDYMLQEIAKLEPASVRIASFLFKPDSFRKNFKIDYIGRTIPNHFIVGYGLDYDDYGRFYRDLYISEQ